MIEAEQTPRQKPEIHINSITFNDGTTLSLESNSIVVFTGANNCGKSQVLKDIERYWFNKQYNLDKRHNLAPKVMTNISIDFAGDINDVFFETRFYRDRNDGGLKIYESANYSYQKEDTVSNWKNESLYNDLHKLFVKFIDTEQRLTTSKALQRMNQPEAHPIFKLNKSEELSQTLSTYFRQAFNADLVVNRNETIDIPLHVGEAPDTTAYTIATQDIYYAEVTKLPRLDEQGDGMRSFASILLDTFTSEHSITLIDEPEAFLHPPQARLLGKMLANNNPSKRQLFISTHSEDFLQGLIDAGKENVTVIRINRTKNINQMSILQNTEIRNLWSNPLLRYSNILSGLFYEKVVVCESDYDCLLYKSVIDAIYESRDEIAPDIMFTHCGGKDRIKTVVYALRALNVTVVAITDFDLLNDSSKFKEITAAFGVDWGTQLATHMKVIYDNMNAKINSWVNIKSIGKQGFDDNAPAAYEIVEQVCRGVGLFVVPVGEIESFEKTVNKSKKDWVYYVIENYDLAVEPKLQTAREFVQCIVDFNL